MELSWHQQRAATIGAAAIRSGKDVQHGFRNCDCCGDSTFGPFDDEFFKCSSCEDTDCDPAETCHCFTGYCDGSGCSYHGECHLRWDYAAEFVYESEDYPGLKVEIAAAGGGTVGEAHFHNEWRYRVLRDDEPFYAGNDLRSGGIPQTHREMAGVLMAFLEADHILPVLV
ncbi:hypothetical protein [Streptomyces sp. NPDC014622]|uniref:hypothetical protein n=1 Tax=Streptomyces sp. NPDC014622 TaxID=3364874 RepID=UPI0037033014